MMNSSKVIGRVAFWNYRKTMKHIIVLASGAFLLLYAYARWTGGVKELFPIYLGGFQGVGYLAILWLFVHLPIEGFLYSTLMDGINKSYSIKILKYKSKSRYLAASLLPLIPEVLTYYITGYGLLLIIYGYTDINLILWQVGLVGLESLSIILTAFLLSLVFKKLENIAFPAVIVIELVNCLICGDKNGVFRFLPFTQGKVLLQKGYFDNGIALAVSLLTLCIILIIMIMMWIRKDERNGL